MTTTSAFKRGRYFDNYWELFKDDQKRALLVAAYPLLDKQLKDPETEKLVRTKVVVYSNLLDLQAYLESQGWLEILDTTAAKYEDTYLAVVKTSRANCLELLHAVPSRYQLELTYVPYEIRISANSWLQLPTHREIVRWLLDPAYTTVAHYSEWFTENLDNYTALAITAELSRVEQELTKLTGADLSTLKFLANN